MNWFQKYILLRVEHAPQPAINELTDWKPGETAYFTKKCDVGYGWTIYPGAHGEVVEVYPEGVYDNGSIIKWEPVIVVELLVTNRVTVKINCDVGDIQHGNKAN